MKTTLKAYVTAAVLATASLAYAQTQDTTPATTPAATTPSTTPAATTPATTPAATTPSTTPAATPSTATQDGSAATGTTESGDDNMADDDTSLAPRSDRN